MEGVGVQAAASTRSESAATKEEGSVHGRAAVVPRGENTYRVKLMMAPTQGKPGKWSILGAVEEAAAAAAGVAPAAAVSAAAASAAAAGGRWLPT